MFLIRTIFPMYVLILFQYFIQTKMKPDPQQPPVEKTKWKTFKRKMRNFFRWVMTIAVIGLLIFFYFRYFYNYSEGYRAGLLQKFSRKGNIFKTYEGELILSSVSSTNNVALASEKFLFSVSNDSLAARLDTLQGINVIVRYKQKHAAIFWRGDSPYIVDYVKPR
jgi:hypothetical protein